MQEPFIPVLFLELCCKGINVLYQNGNENVIYYLAKGLGTPRRDGSGPRLPIDRLPIGLISYNICYFALDKINVSFDSHYVQWEITMFYNSGHKWVCVQRGPGFGFDHAEGEELSGSVAVRPYCFVTKIDQTQVFLWPTEHPCHKEIL